MCSKIYLILLKSPTNCKCNFDRFFMNTCLYYLLYIASLINVYISISINFCSMSFLDGVDNLIILMRDPHVSCLLQTFLSFLTSICRFQISSALSSLAISPSFKPPRCGAASRLFRSYPSLPGSQQDNVGIPSAKKEEQWRFEPPTLGVASFYADR